MAQGFYELLGVAPDAAPEEVREAYQRRLADLVRRLRVARQQGADVSILESQEHALREAIDVLGDPARRRRYDAFRQATRDGVPEDVEALWAETRGALVDPVAGVSLAVVRALTDLPVGDPIPEPPGGWRRARRRAPPAPAAASRLAPAPAPAVAAPTVAVTRAPPAPEPPQAVLPPAPAAPASVTWDDGEGAAATDPLIDASRLAGIDASRLAGFADPTTESPGSPDPGVAELDLGHWDVSRLTDAPLPGGATPYAGFAARPEQGVPSQPAFAVEPPPPPEPADPIEALLQRHGPDGAFLRGVREHRGMDLDALAQATRISTRYLSAIEENGFDRLPAATFVKGYLKQIAAVLEVEQHGVVEGFMALYAQHRG